MHTRAHVHATAQEDRLLDRVMLRLRTSDGLDLAQLQQQFGAHVVAALLPAVARHMQGGLMQLCGDAGHASRGDGDTAAVLRARLAAGQPCSVRLTDPAGFLLSNDVIAGLFAALDPALLLREQ
jgi:coproporphyrinogen III oxidase-like Fe-S oxidoreductase